MSESDGMIPGRWEKHDIDGLPILDFIQTPEEIRLGMELAAQHGFTYDALIEIDPSAATFVSFDGGVAEWIDGKWRIVKETHIRP